MNTDKKPRLVVSTGAGMSAESGITTFRDAGGLWDKYPVMEVASAEGFARNPALIHQFYNERRRELLKAQPNAGHLGLKELEKWYDVYVITQNVDNLHERAGSLKPALLPPASCAHCRTDTHRRSASPVTIVCRRSQSQTDRRTDL